MASVAVPASPSELVNVFLRRVQRRVVAILFLKDASLFLAAALLAALLARAVGGSAAAWILVPGGLCLAVLTAWRRRPNLAEAAALADERLHTRSSLSSALQVGDSVLKPQVLARAASIVQSCGADQVVRIEVPREAAFALLAGAIYLFVSVLPPRSPKPRPTRLPDSDSSTAAKLDDLVNAARNTLDPPAGAQVAAQIASTLSLMDEARTIALRYEQLRSRQSLPPLDRLDARNPAQAGALGRVLDRREGQLSDELARAIESADVQKIAALVRRLRDLLRAEADGRRAEAALLSGAAGVRIGAGGAGSEAGPPPIVESVAPSGVRKAALHAMSSAELPEPYHAVVRDYFTGLGEHLQQIRGSSSP